MKTCLTRVVSSGGRIALALAVLLLISAAAWAQVYTASLTGVVSDPSGAVVPGAKVTLTDADKGFTYNTTADSVGRYLFRSLPPGKYNLSAEAAGFKTFQQAGITLDVNQNANVNLQLQVGAPAETVEVSSSGVALLSTQDAVTGTELDRREINNLPLVGRAVFDLAFLSPGVTQPANGTFGQNSMANNFISNGSRNAQADIIMDGVSTTNYEQNSGIANTLYTPSVDAIQEFKVQQSNFSAEVGFSGATIVNVVFRSGSNDFHGSAYYFNRNSALDANWFFNNMNGIAKPSMKWHDYGATMGGPIRKNKTFFFVDWEGSRSTSGQSMSAGVPSAADRTGDFGDLCGYHGGTFDSAGMCSSAGGQIWDPYTGVYSSSEGGPVRSNYIPFNNMITYVSPGNAKLGSANIPLKAGNLIDPVAYKMLQYYPLPNMNVGQANYDYLHNWASSGSGTSTNDQLDVKIDHRFTDATNLSGRISYGTGSWHGANCFGNIADPCTQGPNDGGPKAAVLNFTHTFSPNTLLTVSYGVTRSWSFTHGIAADYKDFDQMKTLGLPAYTEASGIKAAPTLYIGEYGYVGGESLGSQAWSFMKYGQEVHHLIGTMSHMMNRHELKFGAEMRVHRITFEQAGAPAGVYSFDYNVTSQHPWSGGGNSMASVMIGASPGGWGEYEIPLSSATQSQQFAGFIQDNWRATDKLTLNIGMRYDVDLPRTERFNRMSYVDPNIPTGITAPGFPNLTGGYQFVNSSNRSPYDADFGGYGPRFGFAYKLLPGTVVRGGYGLFYSVSKGGAAGAGAGGFDGFSAVTSWQTTFQGDGATPSGFMRDPFPNGILYPTGSSLGTMLNLGQSVGGPIRSWNTRPQEQSWSFGIQHQLPWQIIVDGNYVGKKGTHLYFANAGDLNHLNEAQAAAFRSNPDYWNAYIANPFYRIITDPNSGLSASTVQRYQLERPFPQFSGFSGNDPPWANSIYNALQLRMEKRFSNGLQFLTTYTWSKSIDDSSLGGGNVTWLGGTTNAVVQDPNNLRLDRSLSQFDIPQIFQVSYQWDLPIGRGKAIGGNMPKALNYVVGGWQTNGIYRWSSGQPIILGLSGGQSLPTWGGQRPNISAALTKASTWTLDQYFADPTVVSVPAPYTLGTAPKTLSSVRGPITNVDSMSLFKEIPLNMVREGTRFEIRVESFNAFNHVQFCGPATTVGVGDFGKTTCQANSPRQIQLGGKLYF